VIEAIGLTKRYGDKLAVDDLSFQVQPGIVTGFLGPNGADAGARAARRVTPAQEIAV
jgi:ABC-type Na+ transport system ATPase subunit NatA